MNLLSRYLPWAVLTFALAYLAFVMFPVHDAPQDLQFEEFAKLPCMEGGRLKPLDTVARNSLMIISEHQTFSDEQNRTRPAIQWLLDVLITPLSKSGAAQKDKVFRIDNDQVLNLLDLKPRSGFRYALEEFVDKVAKIGERAHQVEQREAKDRDATDEAIVKLAKRLRLYIELAQWQTPLIAPPQPPSRDWEPLFHAVMGARERRVDNPAARSVGTLLMAYADKNKEKFNQELVDYRKYLQQNMPDDFRKSEFEVFFNHFEPFYQCSILYVMVFLLTCFSWAAYTKPLLRSAFLLACLALVIHTWALFARMYLMDRPFVFVTNLYSSAVFIGWGCLVFSLILELIFHKGIGLAMASIIGGLTMLIAHHLGGSGDTLEMLQAVLDTNFWLATHVTCVSLGYAATYLAGFLGIAFILTGVFTAALSKETSKALGAMIYGVVCFATFLSFTGTVLGGIWADQSWGRFWGWDPKENGALIIVLWNALILHARWGGMVQQRGMAVLAVVGNIVTTWSWFGVNMLGVGLHSYGFMSGAVFWLVAFDVTQLLIVGVGLLPLHRWRSFADRTTTASPGESSGSDRSLSAREADLHVPVGS